MKKETKTVSAVPASQETTVIVLSKIIADDKYCFRVKVDDATVSAYAEIYAQYLDDSTKLNAVEFPLGPIHVFCEKGKYYVVAGRHRLRAAEKAGLAEMPCIVLTDRKEAIRVGLTSNRHGLALNAKDKAHCIRIAVVEFGSEMSNRAIADMIGCSDRYVGKIVNEEGLREGSQFVKGLDGKTYKVEPKSEKPAEDTLSSDKTFQKVLSVLRLSDVDDQQRVQPFVDIVKTIVNDGFKDDQYRQAFLQMLQEEIADSVAHTP